MIQIKGQPNFGKTHWEMKYQRVCGFYAPKSSIKKIFLWFYAVFLTIKFGLSGNKYFRNSPLLPLNQPKKKLYKTKQYPVRVSGGVWNISSISSAASSCSPVAPSKTPNCVTSPSALTVAYRRFSPGMSYNKKFRKSQCCFKYLT